MDYRKYDRLLAEFERNHSDIVGHVVDWYLNSEHEVMAELDDGTRVLYDGLDGTARYLRSIVNKGDLTEPEWRKLFSIRLAGLLKDKLMTQLELSEKSGVSRVAISSYIRGKALPSVYNLHRIANALGVDVYELTKIE